MAFHMMKNDTFLQTLGETVITLKVSQNNQVVTYTKQLLEQVRQKEEKILTTACFPKFSNKVSDNPPKWNNDVMYIISMSDWEGIFESDLMSVFPKATPATIKNSEHFYKSIRLSLQGEIESETHWGCVIE